MYGHIAYRSTDNGSCLECRSIKKRKKTAEQNERLGRKSRTAPIDKEMRKEYYAEYKKQWSIRNRESVLSRVNEWAKNNPDRVRENKQRYKERHPEVETEWVARRRSALLNRTPKWITQEDFKRIKCKYKEAKWMTTRTGYVHHVDHIIPLNGKTVSGLHVPENLRVMLKRFNQKKGARFNEKHLEHWPIY